MAKTSEQLITSVLRRCFWPATGAPLSDSEILAIADEEIAGDFRQLALRMDGNWYLTYEDQSITADKALYRLPAAMYGALRDVLLVDSAGNEQSLDQLTLEDRGHRPGTTRQGFFWSLEGDYLRLTPTPTTTQDTLRLYYTRAAFPLVLSASALQITGVDEDNKDLTFTSDPDALFDAADSIEIIAGGNSHSLLHRNTIASFPSSTEARLTDSFASLGIRAGDWMAPQERTPILPVPDEMEMAIVKRVAAECLRANGEREAFAREDRAASDAWDDVHTLLQERSEAEPAFVITRNSPLRSRIRYAVGTD